MVEASLSNDEAGRVLEQAPKFSDLLNRVRYRGETFRIMRSGEAVAQLTAPPRSGTTFRTMLSQLQAARTGEPEFADELERIQAGQPSAGESPWDS